MNAKKTECLVHAGVDLVESDKKKKEDETFEFLNDQ